MQKRGSTIATPTTIPPQAVSDRSIIDSVAGFINDVTSSNTHQGDPLTQILWIRFENSADISDASLGQQFNSDLLIILGYNNGIQVLLCFIGIIVPSYIQQLCTYRCGRYPLMEKQLRYNYLTYYHLNFSFFHVNKTFRYFLGVMVRLNV